MKKPTKDIRFKINTYETIKYIGLFLGSTLAVIACAINIVFVSSNDSRSALRIALVASSNALAIAFGILAIVFSVLTFKLKKELALRRAIAYKKFRQQRRRYREDRQEAKENDENDELDVDVISDKDLIEVAEEAKSEETEKPEQ